MEFTLDGRKESIDAREGASLLELLREGCGLTSMKDGCAPEGSCGACTVIVEGKAVVSCAQPAARVAGRAVVTQEGLNEEQRRLWADAFVASGASQCGFCSPGILMKAEALIAKNPDPTRDEVARALAGNLCRCTGYIKIIDAIRLAAAAKRGEGLPEVDRSGLVGTRSARYRGDELALGDKPYINDMSAPGMLHGAVRLSDHPRARVVRIDSSKARALPGVVAIVTADDVPGQNYQGDIRPDWPQFTGEGEITRYVGDILAAVAAEDRRTARDAAALIEVDYEILPTLRERRSSLAMTKVAPVAFEWASAVASSGRSDRLPDSISTYSASNSHRPPLR